jgi:hypothetical protein
MYDQQEIKPKYPELFEAKDVDGALRFARRASPDDPILQRPLRIWLSTTQQMANIGRRCGV